MSRSSLLTSFRLVALILSLCLVPSHSTAAPPPPTPAAAVGDPLPCTDGWQTMHYRTIGGDATLLDAVAVSPNMFWAVGFTRAGTFQPLIQRWDGALWQIVAAPPVTDSQQRNAGALKAVDATSASDAWAVGYIGPYEEPTAEAALLLHWDGTSWSRIQNTGPLENIVALNDIVAISPTNVWAVGDAGTAGPIVLRWDGTTWTNMALPLIEGQYPQLTRIAAAPNGEIWAIGHTGIDFFEPVVLHYTGGNWVSLRAPAAAGGLFAIDVSSDGQVWIAGSNGYPTALRWNGSQLELMPIARSMAPSGFETQSIIANASNDVWLLGYSGKSALLHWDGLAWAQAAHPLFDQPKALLSPASGELWVVGRLLRKAFSDRYTQPMLTINGASISAGATGRAAQFALRLSHASPISVTVDLRTEDAGAVAGRDYTALNTSVTIPGCTTSTTIDVPLVDGAIPPVGAAIDLVLSNPRGAALGTPNTQRVVIDPSSAPSQRIYLPLIQAAQSLGIPQGRLAFAGGSRDSIPVQLYTMNTDGTDRVQLTNNPGTNTSPTWSPDGSQIAFISDRDGNTDIYAMNADGTGERRLTVDPGVDASPAWSPDGTQIAFTSNRSGAFNIHTMRADGTQVMRAVPERIIRSTQPAWSPDSQHILFVVTEVTGITRLYMMRRDGSELRQLTDGLSDLSPAWSPDGQWIAFHGRRGRVEGIFLIKPDGSGLRELNANFDTSNVLSWSPDSQYLVMSDGYELSITSTKGAQPIRIRQGFNLVGSPAWQPGR